MTPLPHVRPIRESDLAGLLELVRSNPDRLTTLPEDPAYLEDRIHHSLRSFYPKIAQPGGECYTFVLDDGQGRLLGTAAVTARVGGFDPFYSFEIRREKFTYPPFGVETETGVLHLKRSHKGPSEIGSLFLHPDCRGRGFGRLLSLSRFLFMGAFPNRFDKEVIAEIRGWVGTNGQPPFWESVARPFFHCDFGQADRSSALGNKSFIEALMPRHPLYIFLLPAEARQAIGRVHPHAEPASHLLKQEGFRETDEVDIFDAGPTLTARLRQIRTVRSSQTASLLRLDRPSADTSPQLLSNRQLDFRAVLAPLAVEAAGATLDPETALALQIQPGDSFTHVPPA